VGNRQDLSETLIGRKLSIRQFTEKLLLYPLVVIFICFMESIILQFIIFFINIFMKILLSSVFKPFGIDDLYGRKENLAELLSSQVTRFQGIFSPRVWCANAGLHLIAANINAETTVLEWPSLDQFKKELKATSYDIIGITFIACTASKMKAMVEVTRNVSPKSKIVIGGYGTAIPNIESYVDVDYICKGEGISYLRRLLSIDPVYAFQHPIIISKSEEFLRLPIPEQKTGMIAAGLGCRKGCDFCSTSSFFNCEYHPLLSEGKELYQLLINQHKSANLSEFWILDENFLQQERRAKDLHDSIIDGQVLSFSIDMIWSSYDNIKKFDPEYLAEMGISTVWIGYESKYSNYSKNRNADIPKLISQLAQYGISTLLSCVLFYDFHDTKILNEDINAFISAGQAYSQFLPLMAWPNTPLYQKLTESNRILNIMPWEERHGLTHCCHIHPTIPTWKQKEILTNAFKREYIANGPSTIRIFKNKILAYKHFEKSNSKTLQQRANHLKTKLLAQSIWVLSAYELAEEYHKHFCLEAKKSAEDIFGKRIIEEQKLPANYLVKKIRQVQKNDPSNNFSYYQPAMRKTIYNENGQNIEQLYF
jgi:hypothetical protein